MKVDFLLNNYNQSTTFGYQLPKYYRNYNWTGKTQELINDISKKIYSDEVAGRVSEGSHKNYLNALQYFNNKRFDATKLDQYFRPIIEAAYDDTAITEYNKFIKDIWSEKDNMSEVNATTESKKVSKFFVFYKRIVDFVMGKNSKDNKDNSTNNKSDSYDLSKINAFVTEAKQERYGSFFDGSNPLHIFYVRNIALGNGKNETELKSWDEDKDEFAFFNSNRDFLEETFGSAELIYKLTKDIDSKLKEFFIKKCLKIMENAEERSNKKLNAEKEKILNEHYKKITSDLPKVLDDIIFK